MNLQTRLNLLKELGKVYSQLKRQYIKEQVRIDEHIVKCERDEVFEK